MADIKGKPYKKRLPDYLNQTKIALLARMDEEQALLQIKEWKEAHNSRKREKYAMRREEITARYRANYRKNRTKIRNNQKRYLEKLRGDPERLELQRARWREKSKRYAEEGRHKQKDTEKRRAKGRRKYQRMKIQALARNDPAAVRKLIRPFIPGYLSSTAQMDVINSMMLQILDRKVPYNELGAWVKKAVSDYNRQFDYFKTVSIDAPIAGTEGLTRADLLDSEVMHF